MERYLDFWPDLPPSKRYEVYGRPHAEALDGWVFGFNVFISLSPQESTQPMLIFHYFFIYFYLLFFYLVFQHFLAPRMVDILSEIAKPTFFVLLSFFFLLFFVIIEFFLYTYFSAVRKFALESN